MDQNEAHQDAFGVWRWDSNGAVPFDDKLQEWGVDFATRARCAAAREREAAEAIEQYKRARASMTDEQRAEEAFERRAAFGPGCEVVDIFTGERYLT